MGATQSIPVVVEVLTITDSGQQGMAGGACELVKDINNFPDQYDIETANKHYTEVKLIQASSRVVFSEAESNTETTAYLLDKGKDLGQSLMTCVFLLQRGRRSMSLGSSAMENVVPKADRG